MGKDTATELLEAQQKSEIEDMEGTALANKIYNEQRKEGWPGLAKETKEICKGLNITDVNTTYLTKNEYKSLVNGAIKRKNEEWLRKEAKGKRKCEKIMRETFGKKNYITKNKVGEVRNIFKARVGMSEFAEVAGKLPDRKMLQFKI